MIWWALYALLLVSEIILVGWLAKVAAMTWTDDYGAHIQAQLTRRAEFDRRCQVPDLTVTLSMDATQFLEGMDRLAATIRRLHS